MNVLIRTDASLEIGGGHVMRCLALADGLRAANARVTFVCRRAPGDQGDLIAAQGYSVYYLPVMGSDQPNPEQDAVQTLAAIGGDASPDWVIVDHYALDARWESAMRPRVQGIMVIDDLANRRHDCDVLLDQNYRGTADARYDALTPASCKKLLGPRFALLRPEFSGNRPPAPHDAPSVRRILVFLSSADPQNVTRRVLEVLDTIVALNIEVDIVVGNACPHIGTLASYCADRQGRTLHVQTSRLAELLKASDMAIGGGGATSWERACLGVPSLVIGLSDNQLAVAEALARDGAHLYLGRIQDIDDATLRDAMTVLLENRCLRSSLARAAFSLTDGRGVDRVIRHLRPRRVSLRPAAMDDCDRLYAWRNHPDTRRYFFDSGPIDLSAHRRWFTGTLTNPSRALLLGIVDGKETGVLRYDFSGDSARISIYLDPARRGEGFGSALLAAGSEWLQENRPETRTVVAEVMTANDASVRAFLAAGYRESHRCYRLDIGARCVNA